MNIVLVTINQDHAAIASWLAAQDFSGCTLAHWQIEPQPMIAEQVPTGVSCTARWSLCAVSCG